MKKYIKSAKYNQSDAELLDIALDKYLEFFNAVPDDGLILRMIENSSVIDSADFKRFMFDGKTFVGVLPGNRNFQLYSNGSYEIKPTSSTHFGLVFETLYLQISPQLSDLDLYLTLKGYDVNQIETQLKSTRSKVLKKLKSNTEEKIKSLSIKLGSDIGYGLKYESSKLNPRYRFMIYDFKGSSKNVIVSGYLYKDTFDMRYENADKIFKTFISLEDLIAYINFG